ncbi:hypothetical protein N7447_007506 [Penicillium robsamsonii]|uniref:uncharacterized protein n=1 Tax=Penicillium robsamsonii TaxID=1792511 RepID=UPI0025473FC7|nr:uncharacterized protein N7447_007506 [Penicillium robsamsonii]KAJ5817498.1 hypothetical protein N7447_007506 [Penicillium robsamsonii]
MIIHTIFATLTLALTISRTSAREFQEAPQETAVYSDIEYQGTSIRVPVVDSCVDLTIVNNGMTCDCSGGTYGKEFQFTQSSADVREQYRDLAQLSIDSIKCKQEKNHT